jgi:hypothetical protein
MTADPSDKKPARPRASPRLVLAVIAIVILGLVSLHRAGYAVLVAGGAPTQESPGGLITLTCKYFTGTTHVITHNIHRPDEKGARSDCARVTRIPRADAPGSPD